MKIILATLLSLTASLFSYASDIEDILTVDEVLRNKEHFHGLVVAIKGAVSLESENITVSDGKNYIGLNLSEDQLKKLSVPNYKYTRVTGTFSTQGEHMSCCKSSLSNIYNVQ